MGAGSPVVDLIVVGGGIVGLATAREYLLRHPGERVVLLEKEAAIGRHQTGHNSGVIHSGIYYKPGSLKARMCVTGQAEITRFCDERGLAYQRCGKLIVALDESELPRLNDLHQRGIANGVPDLEMVGPERMREIEPYVAGVRALYAPHTGITDYKAIARAYADDVTAYGGEIVTSAEVLRLEQRAGRVIAVTRGREVEGRFAITCAGLYSDHISDARGEVRIVPFRGSYFRLRPEVRDRVRALIYPVPDPGFPFLGVHYTRMLDGEVLVGPNAVLALSREGYSRWNLRPGELRETLGYAGFWKLARRYWRTGLLEMYRDYVKSAYVNVARRYMPSLTAADFLPGPSGVRAQALDAGGVLLDDFRLKHDGSVIHVQNAPSPAATSSLVIARHLVGEIEQVR